ncbi:MAG: hypothetical protein LW720_11160 [Pirellula sp.]|nr:hypothetical protein [Pirellula sp.]
MVEPLSPMALPDAQASASSVFGCFVSPATVTSSVDRFGTIDRRALTECEEGTLHQSKTLDRALRSNALFVLLLVLVLSIAVLVLVLEAIQYSNPTH